MASEKPRRLLARSGLIASPPNIPTFKKRRGPLAIEKCDDCRKDKKQCVPEEFGCRRCSEKGRHCPGLTPRPNKKKKYKSVNISSDSSQDIDSVGDSLTLLREPSLPNQCLSDSHIDQPLVGQRRLERSIEELDNKFITIDKIEKQISWLYKMDTLRRMFKKYPTLGRGEERPKVPESMYYLELERPSQKLPPEDRGYVSNKEPRKEPNDAHRIAAAPPRQSPPRFPREPRKPPDLASCYYSCLWELYDKARDNIKGSQLRSNFIEQYNCLKKVTGDPSTRIYQTSQLPCSYEEAWDSAITTMSRLESRPSLMDALCFFCVSRAVAETGENNGISYVAAFNESLEQWRMIFPEIEDVVRLMWNVTFQSVPQPRPTAEQHSELLQLREAVAALIIDADSMFGLCVPDARDEMEASSDCNQRLSRSTDHASLHKDLPGHLLTPREKEPLGRLICPAITSLQEKTHRTPLSELVKLVTTVIFALVVYFVLGFAHISSPMVLGLSNPWYTEIPQTTSTYQSTSYDVSSSSYTETANPSLLPRPSPPFNPFRPNFDVASSPIPVLDQSSLEIFSLSPFREEDGLEFGIAN